MTKTEIRLEATKKNIEKLDNGIKRLMKRVVTLTDKKEKAVGQDAVWLGYDIEIALEDIVRKQQDLKEAEALMVELQAKRKEEKAKEVEIPMVEAVEEFLKKWEEVAVNHYWVEAINCKNFKSTLDGMKWSERRNLLNSKFSQQVQGYTEIYNNQERYDKISKDMAKEVEARRNDLYYRCSKVVGVITDAQGLTIGDNGSINGLVVGENGVAQVETIYAGGYNIQCLHYRVLVKEVK